MSGADAVTDECSAGLRTSKANTSPPAAFTEAASTVRTLTATSFDDWSSARSDTGTLAAARFDAAGEKATVESTTGTAATCLGVTGGAEGIV